MKINKELIQRCSSKNLLPIQQSDGLMDRITHLYLQEQHIKKSNLRALYLYDNKIEVIENLEDLVHLTFLYLHKNAISSIENMDTLSTNCSYQNLPEGQSFEFDPGTITCIAESLRVLNVSGNRLKSFLPLRPLEHLEHFTAEENVVCDLQEVVDVFENWKYARIVKISGNPVCALRKYRDNVVVSCLELEELDGKVVSQPYRNFLLNWKQCQTLQSRKKESYAVLKPFLEARKNQEQTVVTSQEPRSSSVAPKPDRSGSSASSSQSETSVSSKSRSKSAQRARSLQEVPLKLMKKFTRTDDDRSSPLSNRCV
ncbi:protein phosphatase 1 regulatory subunit 42 [Caerostris extrusa]|uniref:Protein phosphatase 1 regulatory subunit 42 n=1 Tax=Caerostris extrusa TaxID=172846 RepID=A0AAV4NA51_CAEEX|nr:protein phosphatase 1 regulatory subunit 42 [Caerostris extrusa]